ncbi:MFS general substrate transporter [Dendrothele bispora CBS 962.96]|uniref:MFS general substrate transporter n=1 Tax=Dendrothele bispora (strain CBS 962.96) TaxID=1314807 RepID=A0A4S8MQ73_DENBC|nr:MFS general substrate transporter [Dendrothele bispora CBS 962.96]
MSEKGTPTSSLASPAEIIALDPKAEAKLRRKLDFLVLPIVSISYTFLFLDRGNIGNAKAAGLEKAIGLHTFDFNIGTCLFYLIFILCEIPCALLVKRFGFWIIPVSVFSFGIVTMASAFIHNRAGFYATRIALGLTESFALPGINYLLTRYYRRSELTSRIGCFLLVAAGSSGAFGGLLAAGLLRLGKIGNRSSWQNIFLVEGIITAGFAIVSFPFFPADPMKTRMLTEEERQLAIARIYADQPEIKDPKESINRTLIKRGIFNPTTMACTWLFIVGNSSVQGLGIFLPSILQVNYPDASTIRIQILVVPIYITAGIIALFMTIGCIKTRRHFPFALFAGACTIAGYSIWIATDSTFAKARYAACFLNMTGGFTTGPVVLGWAASNASPDTVRAMVGAVVTGFGGFGSIAGVWAYVQTDAVTGYHKGNAFNLSMSASLIVVTLGLFAYQWYENKRREQGYRDYRLEKGGIDQLGSLHPSYRYVY